MHSKLFSGLSLALLIAGFAAPAAKADTLNYAGTQFDVSLVQMGSKDVQVTVTLNNPGEVFVNSGNGSNHPGFGFNLDLATTVSIVFPTGSPWSGDALKGPVTVNGNTYGKFDYFIDNPGNGSNADNFAPLVFDLTDTSGISITDFVANSKKYFFVADTGIKMDTAESGINALGIPVVTTASTVPEPSSLFLLGTGALALAGAARRKFNI